MNLKRDRIPEDSPESEHDLGSPTKKALSDVLQSFEELQTSDNVYTPSFICEFVEREQPFFTLLINLDFQKSIKKYLCHNSELTVYLGNLLDAFNNLSQAETAKKKMKGQFEPKDALIRNLVNRTTNTSRKKINFDQLLDLLTPAKTLEAKALRQLLVDGMKSWRLPMFLHLLVLSVEEKDKTTLDALAWVEKRRGFIQSLMNRDPKLLQWLNEEATADMRAILSGFTEAMHALLNEEIEITFTDGSVRKTPKFLDVRALYHTLAFYKGLEKVEEEKLDGEDTDNDSQLLHLFNLEKLCGKIDFLILFLSISVSPWNCFLEIFNSPDHLPPKEDVLRVRPDVLSWLFLAHPQNSVLCSKIMRRAVGVDSVFQAYEHHKKQVRAELLATSMQSMLQSAHYSPSKNAEKRGLEVVNSPTMSPNSRVSPSKHSRVDSRDPAHITTSPKKLFV